MKILVTGSTGFIGSQLCQAMVRSGMQVRAFHRPNSNLIGLDGWDVEHAPGDLTDLASLEQAMQGVDVVFHTAAKLGRPRRPDEMYAVTVEGTRNVLRAAEKARVGRVVHTSSVAALGVPDQQVHGRLPPLINEEHTWNYRADWWYYGHAKYLAEMEVQKATGRGLDVVIVNPAIVMGAGDINRVSGEVILQVAWRNVPVTIAGGANIVHIQDVVEGHLKALERGRCGERYLLTGENLTHTQLLQIIAQVTGVPAPSFQLPAWLVRYLATPVSIFEHFLHLPISGSALRQAGYFFYYDHQKAQRELGIGFTYTTQQAIESALEWYSQRGMINDKNKK